MAALELAEPERFDRRSLNNVWYFPLDGGWEERVTVWAEPPEAPTKLRVQHELVASPKGIVEAGWVSGVKDVFDAWSKRVAAETKVKATKVGSALHFERPGGPRLVLRRGRQASSKAWRVVTTEVTLLPRS